VRVRLEAVELVVAELPLREPWRTAVGTMTSRSVLFVHAMTDVGEGWGECGALPEPDYSGETVRGARAALADHLVPLTRALGALDVETFAAGLGVRGHQMAVAALEEALLDAALRAAGRSLASWLGVSATTVPAGIALGLTDDRDELLEAARAAVAAGYGRIKVKVSPETNLSVIGELREAVPDAVLVVDANGSFDRTSAWALWQLDDSDVAAVEQPLDPDDLAGHVALARVMKTPIALDEPLVSAAAVQSAVELGACSVVSLKRGRIGGLVAAKAAHEWCRERGIAMWVGGMLESGFGRRVNAVLAGLPACTIPGDLSASARFYVDDVAPGLDLIAGRLAVPAEPGVGTPPDPDRLSRCTVAVATLTA
jgi:O-succinylbenzoate synthase